MTEFFRSLDEEEVDVTARFNKMNRVVPLCFFYDGMEYAIPHVLEEIQGETLKQRGAGVRYKIQVAKDGYINDSYLFRFGDRFILAKPDDAIPDLQIRHKGMNFSGKKVIDDRYDNPFKVAVDVEAMCYTNNKVEPFVFWWEDGTKYEIDAILDQERAASLKAGIIGMRYKIRVLGKETFLFRDDDLWFMERKAKCRVLDVHGQPV